MTKGIVAAIAGGVVIVLVIATLAISSALSGNDDTDSRNDDSASQGDSSKKDGADAPVPSADPITAKALVELRAACIGGSVSNAAAYAKPYRYVIYENNNPGTAEREAWNWDMYAVGSFDKSISLDDDSKPSELNVVVCLDRDDSTAVKTKTCKLLRSAGMEDTDSTVADFHAVKYDVTLYEAQSGKKIKRLAAINGPATTCPSAYYKPEKPNIYGDPDLSELNTQLDALE